MWNSIIIFFSSTTITRNNRYTTGIDLSGRPRITQVVAERVCVKCVVRLLLAVGTMRVRAQFFLTAYVLNTTISIKLKKVCHNGAARSDFMNETAPTTRPKCVRKNGYGVELPSVKILGLRDLLSRRF